VRRLGRFSRSPAERCDVVDGSRDFATTEAVQAFDQIDVGFDLCQPVSDYLDFRPKLLLTADLLRTR
jgi:hypothetical protein